MNFYFSELTPLNLKLFSQKKVSILSLNFEDKLNDYINYNFLFLSSIILCKLGGIKNKKNEKIFRL